MHLHVNGVDVLVDAPQDTPLLEALRDQIGIKSAKFGCGLGQCGSCTVLVDAMPLSSCNMPLWSAEGKAVTTLEGLVINPTVQQLQAALIDHQAGQCGYCLPGIIVTIAALLANDPAPAEEKVVVALDRNLCRCGAHRRIVEAVMAVAAQG